jgi:hypothetical protein
MAHPPSVCLITASLMGIALASSVAQDAQAQNPAARTARAAAFSVCQRQADAAVPRMRNTTDQMNHYLSLAACMEARGFSAAPRRRSFRR